MYEVITRIKKKLAIANLAKGLVIARQVKPRIHDLLLNPCNNNSTC